jgi:hypothetical protein
MTATRNFLGAALGVLALVISLAAFPSAAAAQATIVIVNNNAVGIGFNDPTPATPIGGNGGTTLGEQRLIAFQEAARIWGENITSGPTIYVGATFEPLSCTATGATLGSAGATEVFSDSIYPIPGYWYPFSLANKLSGYDLDTENFQIRARFNVNLGAPGCLTGYGWYLGLDGNHWSQIDLVTVLLHEFTHGLGFATYTNGTTGVWLGGRPSAYDHFMLNTSTGKRSDEMSAAERVATAVNSLRVSWTGENVTANVPVVLGLGTPAVTVTAPSSLAGNLPVGTASFGPALSSPGVSGEVMPVALQSAAGPGCDAFNTANTLAVKGHIALIDRGVCGFVFKVKNAQNAGAIGVIIADNVAGGPPAGLGGTDPTITIPAVRITLADANALKSFLKYRSRTHSGLFVTLGVDMSQYTGADPHGFALLFTPNPFQSGSSVSHFDTSAFPNLLMEPNIADDLTHEVKPQFDLTLPLLWDLGWNVGIQP